jgi:uncharacterized protein (DUF1330 family)
MPAYVIVNVRVTDPELYREYAAGTPASIARFGGRFLVRGGATEVREGSWSPERVVVLEFPDGEAARAWYESDDYQALLAIRQRAAESDLVFVEGVAP